MYRCIIIMAAILSREKENRAVCEAQNTQLCVAR